MASSPLQKQQLLPLATLLTLLTVTLLTLFILLIRLPVIETDLLQRTRQALTEAGLPAGSVHFDGRDGLLTGAVSDENESKHVEQIVLAVEGVRAVKNRLVLSNSLSVEEGTAANTLQAISTGELHTPATEHAVEQLDLSAVQFEYSRAELSDAAKITLDQVVTLLTDESELRIEISAHTDDNSTALGNIAVTQARADVVRNYLLSQDIAADRVLARGYGSARPIAENDNDVNRARNRRIEITVQQPE